MAWFGRLLEAIAPGVALDREEKRARLAQLRTITNTYQAAQWDRSFADWQTLGSDANAEIGGQVAMIRNRSRDLARNNPYISRAFSMLSAKIIGKGVRPRLAADVPLQIRSRTMSAWQEWVETCDADAQQDLYGLQLLACRTMIESGEALIEFVPAPDQRIPWQIRILEPDLIDTTRHGEVSPGGARIVHGVEFSPDGQRLAYHMFYEHPGADGIYRNSLKTRRVPAEFIAPLYRQDRPDQVHGVPWIAPCAPLVRHLEDLMETVLKKEKIQACFAGFVTTPDRNRARGEAGIASPYPGITRTEQIAPAMIEYLGPNEAITFANPPAGTNSGEYHKIVLHAIAASLGVTYAQLTGDLSHTNYSSSRTGGLDQWSLLDQWQNLVVKPMMLVPLWNKFEMVNAVRQGRRGAPLRVEWDFPARELLDPAKDGAAKDDALASGRSTFAQMIQESGRDPEMHIAELIRERERFEEAGITFSWFSAMPEAVPPNLPQTPATGEDEPDPDQEEDDDLEGEDEEETRPARASTDRRFFNMATLPPGATPPPQPGPGGSWFSMRAARKGEADIFLHADIGMFGVNSGDFSREFSALGAVSTINVHINSMGGDVFDGLAIYNLLVAEKGKGARITVWVDGIAASIASVIAMAGDEILMPESAFLMIHDPSGMVWGTAEEMERMATTMRGIKDSLVSIYAKRTAQPREEIAALMAAETWMDGPAALGRGFASRLLDVKSDLAACANSPLVHKFTNIPEPIRNSASARPAPKEDNNMTDSPKVAAADEGAQDAQDPINVDAIVERIAPRDAGPQIHVQGDRQSGWFPNTQAQPDDGLPPDPAQQEYARQRNAQQAYIAAVNRATEAGRNLKLADGSNLADEALELINSGVPVKDVPEALIKVYANRQKTMAAVGRLQPANSGARITCDYTDPSVIREQMSDAIAYHAIKAMNPAHKLPDNGAQKYINFRLTDLMRETVKNMYPRSDTRGWPLVRVTDEALGTTTSDFPNILGTSANKVFLAAYNVAAPTYRAIAAQRNLPNFQQHNMVRAGDFPGLAELNEHGEITRGGISESAEVAKLKSHGRSFGVTRQILVNDNLGAFTDMAGQAGRAVAKYENELVWGVFIANPTLATTGAAMFSATHANLTASGTAISATSLGIGRAAMRVQKSLDGHVLNVAPSTLVVPAAKETIAEQVISPLVIPEAASNLTPVGLRAPGIQLVVEPLLDANSGTAWYLVSSPGMGSNLIYGYLDGNEAPRVRTNSPFNVDGIEFQVLMDFYAAAIDFRFGYKNAGA